MSQPSAKARRPSGAVASARTVSSWPVGFSSAIIRDGVWFLSQLWVAVDRQGSGIGSALLDEALAWGHGSSIFSVVASPFPGAQTVYMRRVEKVGNQLVNVEFDKMENVKDPVKARAAN